jgi:hypothetical protein
MTNETQTCVTFECEHCYLCSKYFALWNCYTIFFLHFTEFLNICLAPQELWNLRSCFHWPRKRLNIGRRHYVIFNSSKPHSECTADPRLNVPPHLWSLFLSRFSVKTPRTYARGAYLWSHDTNSNSHLKTMTSSVQISLDSCCKSLCQSNPVREPPTPICHSNNKFPRM